MNHIDIYKESERQEQLRRFNIEKSIEGTEAFEINQDIEKGLGEEEILEKARAGIYKNTAKNRKKGLVGQKYGTKKDVIESVEKTMFNPNVSTNSESGKSLSQKMNELSKEDQEYVNQNYEKFRDFATSKRFSPISEIVKQYKEKSKELSDKEHTDEEVGNEGNDLKEGFTEREFEDFVNKNKSHIRDNMETYDFKKKDLHKVNNYYDVANILGCDSRAVKDIDHDYYMRFLRELL